LQLAAEGERAALDLLLDRVEALEDRFGVELRDDLLQRQHPGMGTAARDVLDGHAFVEIDGGRYDLHDGCGAALEPAAPHFVLSHETPVTLSRSTVFALGTGLLAALALAGVLYWKWGKPVHADGLAAGGPPAALAPFVAAKAPTAVPAVAIGDATGGRLTLAVFKGKYVLLNLWAPW